MTCLRRIAIVFGLGILGLVAPQAVLAAEVSCTITSPTNGETYSWYDEADIDVLGNYSWSYLQDWPYHCKIKVTDNATNTIRINKHAQYFDSIGFAQNMVLGPMSVTTYEIEAHLYDYYNQPLPYATAKDSVTVNFN